MIKFTYPEFLFALVVLLIPLVIHFFHFKRYKTVLFSQVSFLKAVQLDHKKKSDLKKLLILISRLLFLSALVFAFSRPYLPAKELNTAGQKQAVAIYIDNSFSMNRGGSSGPLLEQAKSSAIGIANSFSPGTAFLLLTNDATPRELLPINREQLLQRISGIKESAKSLSFSEAIGLLGNGLSNTDDKAAKNCYLLSDFQQHQFDTERAKLDTLSNYFLVNFSTPASNNLLIDSCWFETPGRKAGQPETLYAKIRNQSELSVQNQAVRLTINDSLKAISDLQLEPGEEKTIRLNYRNNSSGFHLGTVRLDDYPIIYDNSFYFSYEVQSLINVLLIYKPDEKGAKQVEALFSDDALIHFEKVEDTKVQTSQLAPNDFIILLNLSSIGSGLSDALSNFIKNGGTVCVMPGRDINGSDYNHFYSRCNTNQITGIDTTALRLNDLNYNHLVFKDVFEEQQEDLQLPDVHFRYRYSNLHSILSEPLIRYINGQSAITDYSIKKGHLYNFNFPVNLGKNGFMKDAIFVPLIYNMALNSLEPQTISYPIENIILTEVRKEQTDTPPFEIKKIGSEESFQVQVLSESANYARLDFSHLINEAGFYELSSENEIVKKPAFNYNRKESLNNCLSADQIKEILDHEKLKNVDILKSDLPDFEEQIQQTSAGIELWLLFVVLALIFIIMETAIIRWMK